MGGDGPRSRQTPLAPVRPALYYVVTVVCGFRLPLQERIEQEIMHYRRHLSVALVASSIWSCGAPAQETPWPTEAWPTSTPAVQGLDATRLQAFHDRVRAGEFGNVDRMLVIKNGHLVWNEHYPRDYREVSRGSRGALGCGAESCDDPSDIHVYNYFHPDYHPFYQGRDVHTLQSVTKSVAATVIGAAIHMGHISGVDANLLSFLDDYDLSRVDDRLRSATLEDLLTMRSGIEWHEQDRPLDETNTTLMLERSDDWVQFTLDQPSDAAPGSKWVYNSGGSHLMSAVVRKATGQTIDEFAEEHLFGPLGIDDYYWKKTPTGLPDTEGGLYLEAAQLARIGYLYLNDGVWDGERILPEGWVAQATGRQVDSVNTSRWGYGYQWWRLDRDGVDVWAGLGFGGQFVLVLPAHDLIAVLNSWNVFGDRLPSPLVGFLEALLDASGGGLR